MQSVEAAGLGIGDGHPTRIMGVLNVSAESPYDPSVFADPSDAAAYVDEELIDEGAEIVDVGLETANKRYDILSAEEELDRLDTAVQAMESTSGDAVFSIETRYASVAERALERGFDVVNDVCGFADPEMPAVCERYEAPVIKMASPPDLERPGAVEETPWEQRKSAEWADEADYVDQVYEALKQNGFTDRTLVDPAFGGWSEAKTLADDRETFRRLREFRGLGRPILVSINRKNFLRSLADRSTEAALPVSLAATAMAVERGAHVVRTHDVAETLDAVRVGDAFERERLRDDAVGVAELDVTTPAEASRHAERVGGAVHDDDTGLQEFDADETVVRAFELSGLDDTTRTVLRLRSQSVGVQVVDGTDALAFGTPGAFARLAEAVDGPGPLARALDVIVERTPEP